MDRYNKIYYDNYLGTTVVSIFKSHFACFKIQQQNGKNPDIITFLDSSVQRAIKIKRKLNILANIPRLTLNFGSGKEEEIFIDVVDKKKEKVVNLFLQDDISDEEIIRLVYDITDNSKAHSAINLEDKLKLVRDFILKCYSIKKKKQLGDRTFGYLIKAELIPASTPKERLDAWQKHISEKIKPSNTKFFRTPELSRINSNLPDLTLIKHLEKIQSFFNEIVINDVANIVVKDIEKEWSKTK